MPLFNKKVVDKRVALSKNDLTAKLVELEQKPSEQFTLTNSPETDFIVMAKITDTTLNNVTNVESINKNYKAFLLLDEQTHEARYNEEESTKDVTTSSTGISEEKSFFRGKVLYEKSGEKEWTVKRDGWHLHFTPIQSYSFDVNKVRDPIRELVENSGWTFKQVMMKREATYKK